MSDLISRQAAIDAIMGEPTDAHYPSWYAERLEQLPPAQQERIIYGNMSDEEFEKWLYEHGICSPNIHESIPCDAVPLLIDNAISELPSAQPEPAIPLQWIEAQIEWLKSLDNAFSTLTAGQISAMVNKWEDEQDG